MPSYLARQNAQAMQAAMSNLRNGGVCTPDAQPEKGDIARYLGELLQLSPGELRGVDIGLNARLSVAALSGSDSYKVPGDADMVVFQVGGGYRSTLLATEPVLNAAFTQFGPTDMMVARLMNCNVALTNVDRQLPFFDAGSVPLSLITPPCGAPLFFPPMAPYLVPSGITLRADFALNDATAAVVGNAADYWLHLGAFLIPKRV